MAEEGYEPVMVSRKIHAPAEAIFRLLIDPVRHVQLDGSDMLRGAVTLEPITGVGDVFVMRMFFRGIGDYEMINHVVEYQPDRLISWEPEAGRGHPDAEPDVAASRRWGQRWSFRLTPDGEHDTIVSEIYDCSAARPEERAEISDGRIWAAAMSDTLQRLDALCT